KTYQSQIWEVLPEAIDHFGTSPTGMLLRANLLKARKGPIPTLLASAQVLHDAGRDDNTERFGGGVELPHPFPEFFRLANKLQDRIDIFHQRTVPRSTLGDDEDEHPMHVLTILPPPFSLLDLLEVKDMVVLGMVDRFWFSHIR